MSHRIDPSPQLPHFTDCWRLFVLAVAFVSLPMLLVSPAFTTDPLGTANVNPATCASVKGTGGVPGGTCYRGLITCPGVNQEGVAVKVNQPAGTSKGTVIFESGGGGNPWYDVHFIYGATAIEDVVAAGYTAVQLNYEYPPLGGGNSKTFTGWLTGPGGPRALSCRFATMAQWVHDHVRLADTPFCATGESAGSAALGYALAHYGMGSEINMVEEVSGPPFTRIDEGCLCNSANVQNPCNPGTISMCYGSEANLFLNPAYNNTACSDAEKTHQSQDQALFLNDSLLSNDAVTTFPTTYVHFVFGSLDNTVGEVQGTTWLSAISGSTGTPTLDCVADAGHRVPDVLDGATKIADDIIANCH